MMEFEERDVCAVVVTVEFEIVAALTRRAVLHRRGLLFGVSLIDPRRVRVPPMIGDGKPIEVLLIEDSPGDVRLTEEAFRDANTAVKLHVACDGNEAMAFLRRTDGHADAPRPDLILLDLNMPKMDGRQVLSAIKTNDDLRAIPTVILTTSTAGTDVAESYALNANCYLRKPVQLDAFEALVKSINDFWLSRVTLPSETA